MLIYNFNLLIYNFNLYKKTVFTRIKFPNIDRKFIFSIDGKVILYNEI